ncbi:MAG TPA: extracellular solute-binding protein [Paenibacillus sp.]|nr:extracellular solute-binding protein [Paenibacillus sp.]
MRRNAWTTGGIAGLFALTALAGCAAPAQTGAGSSGTGGASGEKVKLALWDNFTEEHTTAIMEAMIADFEKANPNIDVERTAMKNDDLRNTIKPALTSGSGPDIFNYDSGPGYLGVLAKSNLALDLTPYAELHGWKERFPAWVNERVTFDGKLYGIGNEIELIGAYYNKKIFKQLGVDVPKTYEEFLEILRKAKDAGLVGLSFDDKDQWPAFHLESVYYNAMAGKDKLTEVLNKEASFDQPAFAEGLDHFAALFKEGLATANPLAVSYDDGNKEFFAGKAAVRITGTWMVGGMVEALGDDVGFFLVPPIDPSLPLMAPGGLGGAMVASAKTKHPDEAAKFLDFMFAEENAYRWYENSKIPPLNVDMSKVEASALFKEVVEMANTPAGLSYNVDVLMPQKVNDVTMNLMQELIAGKKTGAEVVKEKQKALEEEIAAGNY